MSGAFHFYLPGHEPGFFAPYPSPMHYFGITITSPRHHQYMSNPLADAARLIGEATRSPSTAAAIRSLLDQIDAATTRGVPLAAMVSALTMAGYPVTLTQSRNYLYRARLSIRLAA